MTAFFEALEQGYSPEQVIGYLSKAIPQMSPMIKKAQKAGYPAQQILGFLSKNFESEERRGMSESEIHAANRRSDAERVKYGLQLGAAAIATPLAARAVQGALARALPSSLTQGVGLPGIGNDNLVQSSHLPPQVQQLPTEMQSTLQQSQNISSQPPVSSNIPQQTQPIQPQVITNNISEVINKHGLGKHIDELSQNIKDPKAIAAVLYNKFPKEMKAFQKDAGKPMEDAITEYMQGNMNGAASAAQMKPQIEKQVETESTPLVEEPLIKIERGHNVLSPQGMGEVREVRNGQAIVEIDGKKHKVSEDELIQSPIPEKELADLYEDLISGIEKTTGKQVSRNVDWAGYDPNTNELAYKPHGSDKLYAYEDISPEDVELLTSLLTQRKSTGENFIGAWSAGTESPIGAAMYQLIKKLQAERGGKGSEYKNKYETIYDALEPAKKAAKERHAERKKKAKKPRFD